jgi:protein dithiol oxidoreductase (disulfide-forming)
MRCSDLDAIIDDHRLRTLSAPQRAEMDAHLEECGRCFSAWLTNEALRGEQLAAPPVGSFEAMAQRVRAQVAAEPASGARPWPAVAGLAALLLVVALFAVLTRGLPERGEQALAASPAAASDRALVEGRDYRRVQARVQTASTDFVEVVQLFAYDCGICYSLEQPLAAWLDGQSDDVALVRMPVQWNPRAARFARAFYAAESLGKADEIGLALFDEIHTRGNALDSDDALAEVFARFGVDRDAFDRALAAPATEAGASRARAIEAGYGITTVPSVIVGGELMTDRALAQTPDRMLEIVQQLVKCVEEERRAPQVARHC